MKITLQVGSTLKHCLPAGATGRRADLPIEPDTPLDALLARLGVPDPGRVMTLLNGTLIAVEARADVTLTDGDQLSLMPPLQAG